MDLIQDELFLKLNAFVYLTELWKLLLEMWLLMSVV